MSTTLSYIQFYPTLRCNYSCYFCFNRATAKRDDIDLHDFEAVVSNIKKTGINNIDILGGEPTLHPQLPKLIDITYNYGLKVTMSSNGTNVNILNTLSAKYSKESLMIGISINSDTVSKELNTYILRHKPVLKNVFTRNSTIPEPCKKYIMLPGIDYYLLYMDIINKSDLKHSVPFYAYYSLINELKNRYKNLNAVYCSGFIPDIENYEVLEHVRCPAGTTKVSILPDGSVYPCYLFFRYKEFKLGSILKDDLDNMLQNPILDFFRKIDKNTCTNKGCKLHNLCHGGCPAISYILHKDMSLSDPRCWGRGLRI